MGYLTARTGKSGAVHEEEIYVSVVESCYVHTNIYTLSLLKINAVDSEDVSFFAEFTYIFQSTTSSNNHIFL